MAWQRRRSQASASPVRVAPRPVHPRVDLTCTPSPCSLATKRAPAHFSCSTRQSGAKSGARSRTTDSMCSCSRSGSRRSSVTRAPEVLRSAASALHEAQRASRLTAVAVPGDTTMSSHRATAANETSAGSMRASTVQRPSCRRPRDLSTRDLSTHTTTNRPRRQFRLRLASCQVSTAYAPRASLGKQVWQICYSIFGTRGVKMSGRRPGRGGAVLEAEEGGGARGG